MIRAVIFDFDGVIVDSEPLHFRALTETLGAELGAGTIGWAEYVADYIGFDDRDFFRTASRAKGMSLGEAELQACCAAKQRRFNALLDGVEPIPGTREAVETLVGEGVPIAIASGATREDIDRVLAALRWSYPFDPIVTADDVAASKPDPETYRRAHAGLAGRTLPPASPGEVAAIEDTATGLASARGAGLSTIALGPADATAELEADARLTTLAGLSLAKLNDLLG